MIITFDHGTIRVTPGLGKTTLTIHPDSNITIDTNGEVTIETKQHTVTGTQLGPIIASPAYQPHPNLVTSGYAQAAGGISMNDTAPIYPGAIKSALDDATKIKIAQPPPKEKTQWHVNTTLDKIVEKPSTVAPLPLSVAAYLGETYTIFKDDVVSKVLAESAQPATDIVAEEIQVQEEAEARRQEDTAEFEEADRQWMAEFEKASAKMDKAFVGFHQFRAELADMFYQDAVNAFETDATRQLIEACKSYCQIADIDTMSVMRGAKTEEDLAAELFELVREHKGTEPVNPIEESSLDAIGFGDNKRFNDPNDAARGYWTDDQLGHVSASPERLEKVLKVYNKKAEDASIARKLLGGF